MAGALKGNTYTVGPQGQYIYSSLHLPVQSGALKGNTYTVVCLTSTCTMAGGL